MPHFKSRAATSDGIVHIMNYQTVVGDWLTMCSASLYFEDSDYVQCMPNADEVEEQANCLICIAREEAWNEDGTRKRGREWE